MNFSKLWMSIRLMAFTSQRKQSYIMSVATFLTIIMCTVLYSSEQMYLLYFMNLQENLIGFADLQMEPKQMAIHKDFKSAFSINYTEINYRFCRTNVLIDGCAQRWLFPATLQTQSGSLTLSLASLIVNQTNEIAIGLDKKLDNTTFLNGDEVMLSGSTFDEFLDEGGTSSPTLKGLLLKIDIFELFSKNLGQGKAELLQGILGEVLQTMQRQHEVMNLYGDPAQGVDLYKTGNETVQEMLDEETYRNSEFNHFVQDWKSDRKSTIKKWKHKLREKKKDFNSTEKASEVKNDDDAVSSLINSDLMEKIFKIELNVTIKNKISHPMGKFPYTYGAVIIVNQDYFARRLIENAQKAIRDHYHLEENSTQLSKAEIKDILKRQINGCIFITKLLEAADTPDDMLLIYAAQQILQANASEANSYFRLEDYSTQVLVILKDRAKLYTGNFFDVVHQLAETFYITMGLEYSCMVMMPLTMQMLDSMGYTYLFRNMIVAAVIFVMTITIFVIFLQASQTSQMSQYNVALIRTLGGSRIILTYLIVQILFNSLPGLLVGLICSKLFEAYLTATVSNVVKDNVQYTTSLQSLFENYLLVGVLVPTVSLLYYLRRAFSTLELRHLLVPLSIRSQKERLQDNLTVDIQRLEYYGVGAWGTVISLMLIVEGYLGYYEIPYLLVSQNISRFLKSANIILLILIAGCSLLLSSIIGPLQYGLSSLMRRLHNAFAKPQICKEALRYNLVTHQRSTSKLAWILLLVSALLIFVGTGIKMQIQALQQIISTNIASDLTFELNVRQQNATLSETSVRAFLRNYEEKHPGTIQDFSFVFSSTMPLQMTLHIDNYLSRDVLQRAFIQVIEPNYLNTINNQFYQPGDYDPDYQYARKPINKFLIKESKFPAGANHYIDGLSGLYAEQIWNKTALDPDYHSSFRDAATTVTRNHSQIRHVLSGNYSIDDTDRVIPCALSHILVSEIGVSIGSVFLLRIGDEVFKLKVIHTIKLLPGFRDHFSDRFFDRETGFIVISPLQYDYIRRRLWKPYEVRGTRTYFNGTVEVGNQTVEYLHTYFPEYTNQEITDSLTANKHNSFQMPKEKALIKYARYLTPLERQHLFDGLKNLLGSEIIFFDVIGILEAMESAITLIESLYTVVAVIVLCTAAVAVFLIYEGILEQSEVEIRILRCIGLTKNDLFRMYMIEVSCLMISSIILGVLLGIMISYSLSYEFTLLLRIPFNYIAFPWEIMTVSLTMIPILSFICMNVVFKNMPNKPGDSL